MGIYGPRKDKKIEQYRTRLNIEVEKLKKQTDKGIIIILDCVGKIT